MRSILFIVAGIILLILAIKKCTAQPNPVKQTERLTAHSNIIKNTYALLPEDLRMMRFYNY